MRSLIGRELDRARLEIVLVDWGEGLDVLEGLEGLDKVVAMEL